MTVAKHVDFTSCAGASNVVIATGSHGGMARKRQSGPCLQTQPASKGRAPTKWYKPPAPCAFARTLGITAPDAVRMLQTARLSYAQSDDWVGQRYLFAALVMECPEKARPGAARLAEAEKTLKRLLQSVPRA